ncbi:hypothetical protein [Mycolicibacterium sphagni]|uniref:hypothetical protein n=1 Tax=Mycolicibacterium sphagni TaxID=1786 RepID=UPI0021F2B445|nr:hypothetical protein [Mycolicibacterium sphagni]MCV7174772.1 hypothetical protein [Mycolicibacterium sphagni]
MARTEVRTFEYTCDGWLTDGRKCIGERRVEAATSYAADAKMRTKEPFSVLDPWTQDYRGWLCTREHRAP